MMSERIITMNFVQNTWSPLQNVVHTLKTQMVEIGWYTTGGRQSYLPLHCDKRTKGWTTNFWIQLYAKMIKSPYSLYSHTHSLSSASAHKIRKKRYENRLVCFFSMHHFPQRENILLKISKIVERNTCRYYLRMSSIFSQNVL